MTSLIGNDHGLCRFNAKMKKNGFTFVEVLVALSIISFGLVAIIQSFLISIDRMNYLTNRLYAMISLDDRIENIERMLKVHNALPFDADKSDVMRVGAKDVSFFHRVDIREIDNLSDIFQIDLVVSWEEINGKKSISGATYVANFSGEF